MVLLMQVAVLVHMISEPFVHPMSQGIRQRQIVTRLWRLPLADNLSELAQPVVLPLIREDHAQDKTNQIVLSFNPEGENGEW